MGPISRLVTACVAWLCRIFDVAPDAVARNPRGTVPPPSSGHAGY
jgi:hypothetical protein